MSFFYKSERVGKNGKPFTMWKVRTLKPGDAQFAHQMEYTWCGRFLRKFRIDETPQVWNWLKGDMAIVGIRPLEQRTVNLYPQHVKDKLLSIKPGWFSLSGIYFLDEEDIMKLSIDPHKDYWEKILPLKIALDFFYIDHRCFSLNCVVVYLGIKKVLKGGLLSARDRLYEALLPFPLNELRNQSKRV